MTTSLTSDPLPSDPLPSASSLEKLATLSVFDSTGSPVTFPNLLAIDSLDQVLIIFIRHFYCGSCQDYIRALIASASLTPSALAAHSQKLIIIGCGSSSLISAYASQLSAPWEIYSDPTGAVYDALGMHKSLSLGKGKPTYIKTGLPAVIWQGILDVLRLGPLKGGNVTRVGGEFLWVDRKLLWCHRMKHTRDHLEVPQVEKLVRDWPNIE